MDLWLIVAIFAIFLLMNQRETFMDGPGAHTQGCYPNVYKDFQEDEWHKYWHESKKQYVPTKFDNYIDGAPDYSCNACYYPMPMPFN